MPDEYLYINIHTHKDNYEKGVLSITNLFPEELNRSPFSENQHFSCGLHPWHIDEYAEQKLELLAAYANRKEILAIGETGLDRLKKIPMELQEKVFIRQIELAEKVKKPLIIHCVKAYGELLAVKKKTTPSLPWIIHGFQGSIHLALDLIRHGCYLSFGKSLLQSRKACSVFREVPHDRFFLETDEDCIDIIELYAAAAQVRKIDIGKIREIQHINFKRCFNYE